MEQAQEARRQQGAKRERKGVIFFLFGFLGFLLFYLWGLFVCFFLFGGLSVLFHCLFPESTFILKVVSWGGDDER